MNSVTDIMIQEIDQCLTYRSEKDDLLKAIFEKPRAIVLDEVNRLLDEVKAKKEQGQYSRGVVQRCEV